MRTSFTLFKRADFVHTIVRPVREDRPALDFLRNERGEGVARSYHLDVQCTMFREAFEVTCWRFRDRGKRLAKRYDFINVSITRVL